MQNHLARPFNHFQRPVRGGSIALVAAVLLPALLYTELAEVARAAITTSGELTGTGTPYNGTDNPWATEDLIVGNTAPGSMAISGGFVVNNGGLNSSIIGNAAAASTSTVTVGGGAGSSSWTNSSSLVVGRGGNGTLDITGGGSVSNTSGTVGATSGSNGTVTVGGGTGASTWTNSGALAVGSSGTGKLDITGGGSVSNTNAVISLSGIGTVTVGGGTGASSWTNSGTLTVGLPGPGTRTGILNINTGGLVIATALNGGTATSSVKLGGGTLRITATDSATNTINLLADGGTFDVPTAATTFTVTSSISGAGGLTKTGGATLELTAANTYDGNTTVHAGTLKLSGVGGVASSPKIIVGDAGSTGTHLDVTTKIGGLTIGATQTLAGIGTIDGNTTILGTHSPGNSPGLPTFNGDLSYATGSNLNWELAANKSTDTTGIRGTDFDGINVTGAGILKIAAGAISNLIFNAAGSLVSFADAFWKTSHTWLVYSNAKAPELASPATTFDTILFSKDSNDIALTGGSFSWAQDGNDVRLNYTADAGTTANTPEPSTFVMMAGLALAGLGYLAVQKMRRRNPQGSQPLAGG